MRSCQMRSSSDSLLAMWLARKHTRSALSEIGYFFGRRSHSTVVAAQKKVNAWMASGRALDLSERAVDCHVVGDVEIDTGERTRVVDQCLQIGGKLTAPTGDQRAHSSPCRSPPSIGGHLSRPR